ncbi:ABC transporter ATP-binding protein [Amaricoccus tamworthensis]|uniref:ABC transporter ATP-binding protein n=1 Tax=Amaricoccus tamworthensis TaxID=57002 RepID=UPI003C7B21E7
MLQIYKMLIALFTSSERRIFFLLMGLIVFSALMETVGVASILPFLAILSDPSAIDTNPYLSMAYTTLGFENHQSFLLTIGICVFTVVVLNLGVKILTLYAMARFSFMRCAALSTRLLSGYLHQPYTWFLNRNSADLGKSLLSEIDRMAQTVMLPAMRLLANLVVVVFLIGLVVVVNPTVAMAAAGLIMGSYVLIFVGLRKYISRRGKERLIANGERFQIAQEALGGAKEVKLMGLEEPYIMRFRKPAYRMAGAIASDVVLGESPRYILEGIAFGGMLLLIIFMLISGDGGLQQLLPLLGVYAFAGLRLFPALQQVFRQASGLRFNRPTLESLYKDYIEGRQNLDERHAGPPPPALPLRQELELRDVHYAYPQADRAALNGMSMLIKANTTVGIVGGTGAGKTTAVDLILGLLSPQSGEFSVDGVPVTKENRRSWQRSIGYVPQQIFLTDESVRGNIAFGVPADQIDEEAMLKAAKIAELHDFVMESMPQGYDTMVGERGVRLSGGQRQRIGIARALYHDPDVLILDEATSALDNLTERAVMDAVHNLGQAKTIIMIAHRLTTVRDCNVILMLQNGQVIGSGTYDELIERNEEFRALASGDKHG